MIDRFISWLYTRRIFGKRCVDYDPGCACCEAWATHDWLFNGAPDPNFVAHLSRLADGVESGEIETIRTSDMTDKEFVNFITREVNDECFHGKSQS